jgi:hypothetical protein
VFDCPAPECWHEFWWYVPCPCSTPYTPRGGGEAGGGGSGAKVPGGDEMSG